MATAERKTREYLKKKEVELALYKKRKLIAVEQLYVLDILKVYKLT
jgi:hypothetical protein